MTEGPATFHGIDIALLGTIAGALSRSCYGVYLYASRKATVVNPGRFIQPMTLAFLAQLVAPTLFILFAEGELFEFDFFSTGST